MDLEIAQTNPVRLLRNLSNWTVRTIMRALKWRFFITASKTKFRISCVLINKK